MHNELDKYLHTVAHELRGLEPHQREAELREIRGHLEAIVARLMDGGASEAEATEAAIAQFGAARKVGRDLKRTDEAREPLWRMLLAPVAGAACVGLLAYAEMPWQQATTKAPWPLDAVLSFGMGWPTWMVGGAVVASISPKWGARLSMSLLSAYILALTMFMRSEPAWIITGCVTLLMANSGILLGSRWANRHLRRKTDAQRV
jgi:hypothetical protein